MSFHSLGEYYNYPPQIFLKFSGLQYGGMERYPSPNLRPKFSFTTLKIASNLEQFFFRCHLQDRTLHHVAVRPPLNLNLLII